MLELMIFFWGGGGTRVSDLFTKNPNLKKRDFIFLCLGVGGGRGSEVAKLSVFL